MNLLDENISAEQRKELLRHRVRVRQIGYDVARKGIDDIQQIVPLLLRFKNVCFFTRDRDFISIRWCTQNTASSIDVEATVCATYIRRFLRHKRFRRLAERLGTVVRRSPDGIHFWKLGSRQLHFEVW